MQSELERISDLAKKAAVLDGCMYVVYQKGKIIEYRHYL